jgi:hypothetical protein
MSALRVTLRSLSLASLSLLSSACVLPPPGGDGTASGTVYLWVSADKDTFASCGLQANGCPEQNLNYGQHGTLSVAFNGVALKKTYVHFTPPTFPAGTVIEEAYFEMNHGGQNEDGQSDDIDIPVAAAVADWSPMTLTWANQPNNDLTGGFTSINLISQDWSGTPDISTTVIGWHDNPSTNTGLAIYWPNASPGIEKGFYSNNDISRTASDLGKAPRLLIKAQFPEGTSTDDMQLGFLPADNDLDLPGQILMVRFQSNSDWPADWEVRKGQ